MGVIYSPSEPILLLSIPKSDHNPRSSTSIPECLYISHYAPETCLLSNLTIVKWAVYVFLTVVGSSGSISPSHILAFFLQDFLLSGLASFSLSSTSPVALGVSTWRSLSYWFSQVGVQLYVLVDSRVGFYHCGMYGCWGATDSLFIVPHIITVIHAFYKGAILPHFICKLYCPIYGVIVLHYNPHLFINPCSLEIHNKVSSPRVNDIVLHVC